MKINNALVEESLVGLKDIPIGTIFMFPHNTNWPDHVFTRIWNVDRRLVHMVRLDSSPGLKAPQPAGIYDKGGRAGQTYTLTYGYIDGENKTQPQKYLARVFPSATLNLGEPKK